MGRRKDQDAVYKDRIRQLPAGLYGPLWARATDPFSEADTKPFFVNGRPGGIYVSIAFRPGRKTKVSLGPPDLVLGVLRALGFSDVAGPSAPACSLDLPPTPPARAYDRSGAGTASIVFAGDLPHNLEEAAANPAASVPTDSVAANESSRNKAGENNDQEQTGLESAHHQAGLIHQGDLPHVVVDGLAQLSDSVWKLPALSTLAAALVIVIGDLLVPGSPKSPTPAFAEESADLPQAVPSLVAAANTSSFDISQRSGGQVHLPRPTKAEDSSPVPVGKLATLFAAVCQAANGGHPAGPSTRVAPVSVRVDAVPTCGEILERTLLGSSYASSPEEIGIHRIVRTGITSISLQESTLVMQVQNVAAYRQAIMDRDDPSRSLAGICVGGLWLAFKPDCVEVTEVAP